MHNIVVFLYILWDMKLKPYEIKAISKLLSSSYFRMSSYLVGAYEGGGYIGSSHPNTEKQVSLDSGQVYDYIMTSGCL